jgi:hypothetical protein
MIYLLISEPATKLPKKSKEETHLFMQFYVDANPKRQAEIRACLYKNLENPFVRKVHLLNERLYTNKELGVKSAKIVQTVIGSRLKYGDIFRYVNQNNIQGYIIIANSDILFDATLENLFYSDISLSKKVFAQLRYEYNPIDPSISRLFGPRYDSQDVWIFHSNFVLNQKQTKLLDFPMGKPGCDNRLIYILSILGYTIINDPAFIRTLHYHSSQQRNYTAKDAIKEPYGLVVPNGHSFQNCANVFGLQDVYSDISTMPKFSDNDTMYNYILSKFAKHESFIIPRVAGFENDFAYIGDVWAKTGNITDKSISFLKDRLHPFANNAGIYVRNQQEIMEYARKYQSAFEHCELYTGWEPHGGYYRHIPLSHDYITTTYANKQLVWTTALNIFYYIYSNPWTRALRGKRILIVSAFADSILEKIPFREKIYDGVDLFPECTFIAIRPPQTQGDYYNGMGDKEYFGDHLTKFTTELDKIRELYDVALVSCGGYGNLVCNHIFESGKSAIYVGGVLQMYFGIMGSRWLKDEPDVVRLFLNEYWTRPKEQERPSGYKGIENGCYW